MKYYIGVDVGSGSARAGIFNEKGFKLADSAFKIQQYRPQSNHVEQSSNDIWKQVCRAVQTAVNLADIDKSLICGIGFDATCSLVALDKDAKSVSISTKHNDNHNIVMWMDHRAIEETNQINATQSPVLDFVGGKVSIEMELPKIKWIKKHLPEQYKKIDTFIDLADYLVFRATGKFTRSVCTMSCKWNYLSHEKAWDMDFLNDIGLSDLISSGKLKGEIKELGATGDTLSSQAAADLGLTTNVSVAVGIIDAHAGGLALINNIPENTLAIIAGTSSCHMASSKEKTLVKGIWGGYYNAMLPGYWLLEGGQSATGALIDYVIKSSNQYPELKRQAKANNNSIYQLLNNRIYELEKHQPEFMVNYHMLGYHHGNRSPRADATLRGMVTGLSLEQGIDQLAIHYLAAIQSIAYGTRHIIEAMSKKGIDIKHLKMCGGDTKNPLFIREHADITGLEISLLNEPEAVLLGSAIMAAVADKQYSNFKTAINLMSSNGMKIQPNENRKVFHDLKYKVFKEMYKDQIKYKNIMNNTEGL